MSDKRLLEQLRDLEMALHQPRIRSDGDRLEELLHEEFFEFGKSGARFTQADMLELLPAERGSSRVWSESYELAVLADGVALLTYRAAHADEAGNLTAHSLRSSLWLRTVRGWQVRFHQGTPTEAFRRRIDPAEASCRAQQ